MTYLLLRLLCSIQGTTLLTVLDTLGIERATHDVVTHTREILHTAAAHEHDGVLLQIVAFARNVGGDFDARGQAHTSDLTQSRVRLLRGGVIEIGPGIGVLTKELAKRAAKVVSIEVDERLPPLLAETMAGVDNFKLVLQDVLKVDLKALIAEEFPGMPVAVCANLPYYITSPIVMKLLGDRLPIESLTVMVQKEAADRLAAVPGTRASSAISCAVNYYATSKLMFTAAPGSFYPAPKVTSAVVRMDIRPTPAVQVEDEVGYFALVRAAFGQRRKTAANAIAGGLNLPKEKVIAAIESAGFDARIRPEALTLEDFAKIQQALG